MVVMGGLDGTAEGGGKESVRYLVARMRAVVVVCYDGLPLLDWVWWNCE